MAGLFSCMCGAGGVPQPPNPLPEHLPQGAQLNSAGFDNRQVHLRRKPPHPYSAIYPSH